MVSFTGNIFFNLFQTSQKKKEKKSRRREESFGPTPRGKVSFRDAASPQLVGHQGQSAWGSVHGVGYLRKGGWREGDRVLLSQRVYTLPATESSGVEGARPFGRSAHVCAWSNLERCCRLEATFDVINSTLQAAESSEEAGWRPPSRCWSSKRFDGGWRPLSLS